MGDEGTELAMTHSLGLVAQIREDIMLLQELERFAQNPRALELMRTYVSVTVGTTTGSTAHEDREGKSVKEKTPRKANHGGFGIPTGLTEATWTAVESMDGDFVVRDVIDKMEQQGYKFQTPIRELPSARRCKNSPKKTT